MRRVSIASSIRKTRPTGKIVAVVLTIGTAVILLGLSAITVPFPKTLERAHHFWEQSNGLGMMRYLEQRTFAFAIRQNCEFQKLFQPKSTNMNAKFGCDAHAGAAEYKLAGYTYRNGLKPYNTFGPYLNFSSRDWNSYPAIKLDKTGLPMFMLHGYGHEQPVTMANFALSMYGKYLEGDKSSLKKFQDATAKLLVLQNEDGAFRYEYEYQYYLLEEPYKPGWVSGLAQGTALSVFARAYHKEPNPKYLFAGERALKFMVVPVENGGVMQTMAALDPALNKDIFFDEYPATPSAYTLNGFMFTLLGIYDWSQIPSEQQQHSAELFRAGVSTLKDILHYYDLGAFTTYDLAHLTYHHAPVMAGWYHGTHITLLHALASITSDKTLAEYEKSWTAYVEN